MAASYPSQIKSFVTYQDQPGPDNLTIDYSAITNEIHDEVVAIEKTLGLNPFFGIQPNAGGPQRVRASVIRNTKWTLNDFIVDLRRNKAPVGHTHNHAGQTDEVLSDDHPQYAHVDGRRSFTAPIGGRQANMGHHLIRWDQAQALGGLTIAQFNALLNPAIAGAVAGRYPGTGYGIWVRSPFGQGYLATGGWATGVTDYAGDITCNFGDAFPNGVQAFNYMNLPLPNGYNSRIGSDLLFVFGSSALTSNAPGVLNPIIADLAWRPAGVVTVDGHTDSIGSFGFNLTLSQQRAQSVINYIAPGLPGKTMNPVGHSFSNPVAPNTNPDGSDNPGGRALNRRVEVSYRSNVGAQYDYVYNYLVDSLVLIGIDNRGATVRFLDQQYQIQRGASVSFVWIAIGG